MRVSNWHNNFDLSHPNWTAKTRSRPSWADYEGVGGYAPNSRRIPKTAIFGAALVVALFIGVLYVGAGVGF